MSYRLLNSAFATATPGIKNETRDDLESFLWVFCYALQRKAVTENPGRKDLRDYFRRSFGRLDVNELARSRRGRDPAVALARFHGSGISDALLRWFAEYGFDRAPFTLKKGYEFTYDMMDAMFDDALAAIREDSTP